jgi:hypothetical protein
LVSSPIRNGTENTLSFKFFRVGIKYLSELE